MNHHKTIYRKPCIPNRAGKTCCAPGLILTKSILGIGLLSMLAVLAWSTPTFAQKTGREQVSRPQNPQVTQVATTAAEPVVIGTATQQVQIPGTLKVAGGRMEVVNSAIGGGTLTSNLYIRQLNQAGSPAHLCWKVAPDGVPGLLLTTCTSSQSSLRYKTDLHPFLGGLDVISRLKPYNFAWKNTGSREIGLIAEDVAEVEPLFTYKNEKGEIEGVKYENMNVLFINAFKEQQTQIEELRKFISAQQEQLKQQSRQIEALRTRVSP
jgi:hypothetical protein